MKHERVLIRIEGDNPAADRVRAKLGLSPRYVQVSFAPNFVLEIQESTTDYVVFDGVHGELESLIATHIQQLAGGEYHVLQAAGVNFDERRIRIICPMNHSHREAVAEGLIQGLDKYVQKRWSEGRGLPRWMSRWF